MALEKKEQRTGAYIFGIVFIVLILVIAIFIPNPSSFQYTVFRIVLALAAAGVAAMIPGFISVEVGNAVRAGGAIAVFRNRLLFQSGQFGGAADGAAACVRIRGNTGCRDLRCRPTNRTANRSYRRYHVGF